MLSWTTIQDQAAPVLVSEGITSQQTILAETSEAGGERTGPDLVGSVPSPSLIRQTMWVTLKVGRPQRAWNRWGHTGNPMRMACRWPAEERQVARWTSGLLPRWCRARAPSLNSTVRGRFSREGVAVGRGIQRGASATPFVRGCLNLIRREWIFGV